MDHICVIYRNSNFFGVNLYAIKRRVKVSGEISVEKIFWELVGDASEYIAEK